MFAGRHRGGRIDPVNVSYDASDCPAISSPDMETDMKMSRSGRHSPAGWVWISKMDVRYWWSGRMIRRKDGFPFRFRVRVTSFGLKSHLIVRASLAAIGDSSGPQGTQTLD
jgi:hypothetical protein